jgi:UDP:flavonoid glycosyltransferase YjiC (YdhE family)
MMNLRGLAVALERRGTAIAFAASGRAAEFLSRQTSYEVYNLPTPTRSKGAGGETDYLASQGLTASYLHQSIEAELRAVDAFRPHAIVADLQLTSVITAHYRHLPHVGIARWTEHSSFKSPFFQQLTGSPDLPFSATTSFFNLILERYDQQKLNSHPLELTYERSDIRIVPSSPLIETELALRTDYDFVGYLDPPVPDTAASIGTFTFENPSAPKVLCYLSDKGTTFPQVLPALQVLRQHYDADIVVVDPSLGADTYTVGGIRVFRFLSSLPILSSDVVISTGTRGVSQQALLAGAGLLFIGSSADEEVDFTARRLEELGAAIRVSLSGGTGLCESFDDALGPELRHRSRTLGISLYDCGGPDKAAEVTLRRIQAVSTRH